MLQVIEVGALKEFGRSPRTTEPKGRKNVDLRALAGLGTTVKPLAKYDGLTKEVPHV